MAVPPSNIEQLLKAIPAGDLLACEVIFTKIKLFSEPTLDLNSFQDEYTPLHLAMIYSYRNIPALIKLLLENGANPALLTRTKPHYQQNALGLCLVPGFFLNEVYVRTILEWIRDTKDERLDLDARMAGKTLEYLVGQNMPRLLPLLKETKDIIAIKQSATAMRRTMYECIITRQADTFAQFAQMLPGNRKVYEEFKMIINEPFQGGRTLLDFAIIEGSHDSFFCKSLLGLGADVSVPSLGKTPIKRCFIHILNHYHSLMGVSYGLQGSLKEILVALINGNWRPMGGANLREAYANDSSLLSILATTIHLSEVEQDLARQDVLENWVKIRDLIINAHRFDQKRLMDIYGYKLSLEGLSPGITTSELLASYQAFIQDKELQEELNALLNVAGHTKGQNYLQVPNGQSILWQISEDFRSTTQIIPLQAALRDLQVRGKVISIPVLTSVHKRADHAMSYMVFNDGKEDHVMRVNCGATLDPRGPQGFHRYIVKNVVLFRDEMLPRLLNSRHNPISDTDLLSYAKNGTLQEVATIQRPKQIVGNCSLKSSEELLHAVMLVRLYFLIKNKHPEATYEGYCWSMARYHAEKLFALFILSDRKRGHEQLKKFERNIPHSLKHDADAKVAALEKQNQMTHKYWLDSVRAVPAQFEPRVTAVGCAPQVASPALFKANKLK